MEEPIELDVLDDDSVDFLASESLIINAVSPRVSISNRGGIPKVQRVTVTDVDGSRYFDVSDGAKGDTGDAAGFGSVSASIDDGIGTPNIEVSSSGSDTSKNFSFNFHNLKGETGDTGDAAGFGSVSASIDNGIGTPNVEVSSSGSDTSKNFSFNFHNLKGKTGDTGPQGLKGDTGAAGFDMVVATVDDEIGTPSVEVLTSGGTPITNLTLKFHNLKGETGDILNNSMTMQEVDNAVANGLARSISNSGGA